MYLVMVSVLYRPSCIHRTHILQSHFKGISSAIESDSCLIDSLDPNEACIDELNADIWNE